MTAASVAPRHVVPLAWPSRSVPMSYVIAYGRGEVDPFIHLTPESHPMARYVIGFAACPLWWNGGHRSEDGDELLLTLWLTPLTGRCTACAYEESLAAFMARMGWEQVG